MQNTPEEVAEIDEIDAADTKSEAPLGTPLTPDLKVEVDMKKVNPEDNEDTRKEWQPSDEAYTHLTPI